jgi:ureidoacrylate peracid hydrolase
MDLDDIEIEKTTILFYDMQNGYIHADQTSWERMKSCVENAIRLLQAGRNLRMPIFFAKGDHRADGLTLVSIITDTDARLRPFPDGVVRRGRSRVVAGEWSSEVIPELQPRPDDYYIPKHRWSAFHQTYLDLALRARNINTIIVSGNSTDIGVAATVFAGRDLDYNLIVARDACATAHDTRAHDVLMELIFPRMARVRTTEQILRLLDRPGSNA